MRNCLHCVSKYVAMQVSKEKVVDHHKKHDHDVGEQNAELAQIEEDHLKDRLAEMEQLYQRRVGEMRNVLGEASKSQQEVQAKTSQVKQYKKQVDTLKDKVCSYTSKELI